MKAKNVATPKNIVASRCFDCCPHGAFFELPTFIKYSSLYVWLVQSTRYVKHTLTRHHSGLTKLFSTLKEAWLLSCRDTYISLFSMTSRTNMWYFFFYVWAVYPNMFFWLHCSCVPTLLFAWKAFSKMKRCTLNFAPFFFLSVVFFQKSIVIWNLKVFLQGFDFVNCQRGLVLDASSWPLYLYLYVFDFPISILEWQPFKTCPLYDFYLNNQLKHDP